MAELVRKLSPDSILGPDRKRPEAPTWFYRIMGRVTGSESGTTQYGPYTELSGEFTAFRFDTGETFTSFRCFLPCGMADSIAERLKVSEGSTVEFVFDIGLKPATGKREGDDKRYEYMISNPMDDDKERVSKILSLNLPPNVKQLPKGK